MNQQQQPNAFRHLVRDRAVVDIPDFNEEHPHPFGDIDDGEAVDQGWTFFEFLNGWENNDYPKNLWWKFGEHYQIIGFESEGRKMFLRIAEIVISFHERKVFSGNLVRRIRILPDLNVTHESSPVEDEHAFEHGGQRSDIEHFRWMVAAVVRTAFPYTYREHYQTSFYFRLFFSEIFTVEEGIKYYFVSQLYHPIFFNSSDRCNLIRMMRDLYNLNPKIFRDRFTLRSYGFIDWWSFKSGYDAFHRVLDYNFDALYSKSNGFALPLYIRNVHEHFLKEGEWEGYHEDIDLEIDNLFPGVSAAIIDLAIRNLHGYWDLFGSSTTTTLPYFQRTSPYGWCFPYYRFRN